MQYQVIARKYRPKCFGEVVGQESIVTTLKNAIKRDNIAHAYLFTGSKGVGKTTLARLFAKALNCNNLKENFEPCCECQSCLEIAASCSMDVLEIDGASNRGIDDVRAINETVGYASAGKYKIFIIDEVHMLTKEAFNALLKTLEEPPKHVKFFFATTEPSKVIPTIISRCQRFDLRRIPGDLIANKLELISQNMGREVEKEALHLISSFSEGSLRDAESFLDQIFCFEEGKILAKTVRDALGLTNQEEFFLLDQTVLKKDIAAVFDMVERLFHMGKDFSFFLEELIDHFRLLLVAKVRKKETDFYSKDIFMRYEESSKIYTREECLSILEMLLKSQQAISRGGFSRVSMETLLLTVVSTKERVSLKSLVDRLENLERQPPVKMETKIDCTPDAPPAESCTPKKAGELKNPFDQIRAETILRFAAEELEGVIKREE